MRSAPRAPGDGQDGQVWLQACGARQLASVVRVFWIGNLLKAVDWSWRSPGCNGLRGSRRASKGRGSAAARSRESGANPQLGCRVPQEGGPDQVEARRSRRSLLL